MLSSLFCCCSSAGKERRQQAADTQLLPPLAGREADAAPAAELRLFAHMWCRSSAERFALEQELPSIGVRQGKCFCWIKDAKAGSGGLLGWLFPGTARTVLSVTVCERAIGLHERPHLERVLGCAHPVLLPLQLADVSSRPDRLVLVRDWRADGSLRDALHGASPDDANERKYDRIGMPLSEAKIARFGRALLEALLVLRPLGPQVMMHMHLGNVFLAAAGTRAPADGSDRLPTVQLSEWEQGLLGLPSHLEPFYNDLRRSLEPAACALALCVYEMACGFELDGLPPVVPPACPCVVREALEELLRPPPPRTARAACFTLEDARELPLFASAAATPAWPPLPEHVLKHAGEFSKVSKAFA